MGLSPKPQIKPLLSEKVEQTKNIRFDKMSYELYKPYVPPVLIITEFQNLEKVMNDFVSDEEVAAELNIDYDPPCSQQTYKADIRNAKARILERRNQASIQGKIKYISKSMD